MLQKRGEDWPSHPGFISAFGGRVETGEKPDDAIIRELNNEVYQQPRIIDDVPWLLTICQERRLLSKDKK